MRIRYEEPVDKTNMSLLATIAVIIFGGIIAVNFSSISDSAAETTITNLAFIPALLLMVVLFAIGHFNSLKSKKSLGQYVEYRIELYNKELLHGLSHFYLSSEIKRVPYISEMKKNIADIFVIEKEIK